LCKLAAVDPPRLLHRRLEAGYTDSLVLAAAGEPEAVDADTQERITHRAQRAEETRRRDAWHGIRGDLQHIVDELGRAFGPAVADELRDLRRGIDRLNRKLA